MNKNTVSASDANADLNLKSQPQQNHSLKLPHSCIQ